MGSGVESRFERQKLHKLVEGLAKAFRRQALKQQTHSAAGVQNRNRGASLLILLLPKMELLWNPFRGNVLSSDWHDNGLGMEG